MPSVTRSPMASATRSPMPSLSRSPMPSGTRSPMPTSTPSLEFVESHGKASVEAAASSPVPSVALVGSSGVGPSGVVISVGAQPTRDVFVGTADVRVTKGEDPSSPAPSVAAVASERLGTATIDGTTRVEATGKQVDVTAPNMGEATAKLAEVTALELVNVTAPNLGNVTAPIVTEPVGSGQGLFEDSKVLVTIPFAPQSAFIATKPDFVITNPVDSEAIPNTISYITPDATPTETPTASVSKSPENSAAGLKPWMIGAAAGGGVLFILIIVLLVVCLSCKAKEERSPVGVTESGMPYDPKSSVSRGEEFDSVATVENPIFENMATDIRSSIYQEEADYFVGDDDGDAVVI